MKTHELVPCKPIGSEKPIILGRRGKTRRQTVRGVGAIEPDDGSQLTISANIGKVGAKSTLWLRTTYDTTTGAILEHEIRDSSIELRNPYAPRHQAEFGEPVPS
jgi:hypothetical protein